MMGAYTGEGIAALFRGFMFLANRVAALRMEQLMGKTVTPELPPLLDQPNPLESYRITMIKIMYSLLFRGNAYIWIRSRENGTGIIRSIYVLNPDEVSVQGDALNLYPEYRWTGIPGRTMEQGKEIVHIPLNLFPGYWKGVSPVEAFRIGLEGIQAEQEMARDLMVNNGSPSGILKDETVTTASEASAILDLWEASQERTGRRGGPRVMGKTTSWEKMTFAPLDLQFLEQRKFSVQEIARLLGLDPFFLGEQSGGSMTYSTTESLLRLALTQTIEPDYLNPIEEAFTSMLPSGRRARFDVDEILRADMEARYRAGVMGVRNGLITKNEWREGEGLSPVSGGDELVESPDVQGSLIGVNNA